MSLFSILLLLLAFGVAVWVVGKVCYKKGHADGTIEEMLRWIKTIKKYKEKPNEQS